jgi:hypothetical protein
MEGRDVDNYINKVWSVEKSVNLPAVGELAIRARRRSLADAASREIR